ncbi:SpoIID/LytB domain-containing protein [Kovacikia minuta CCNUW1]|uniref:SpoIID/LytB domain-containing protein n=1 Tax=Kovacikia minuta TaxID=2931930 RepID=UPI001CCF5CCB|nr:SpoIID/LytB domain-containing protein [Kovacikia minuta]UBF23657.1 SpoIID/LytB domain-containing protein [Kovacikia minuta CCNUW1]
MTEQRIPDWLKRYFWVALPLLGGFSIGAVLLNRQPNQPSPQPSEQAAVLASPSPTGRVSPVPSPSPSAAAKSLQAPQKPQPAKAPPKSVNPASFTPEQKVINQKAKAKFLASAATVDSLIEMKVAIGEGLSSATVGASTEAMLLDQNGKQLHQLSPGATYTAQPNGSKISFGAWQLPSVVVIDPGPGGLFQLGNRLYRGRLLLVSHEGNLWGINYVNMRQYLYSVVGSEVSPSWHPEALKAQAVAARSYALTYYFKPVNSLYHLGATEYYQVYSGIEREADTIRQAVDTTAGQFVSYRGGIVESLYAASDDIVAEAFQGKGMSQLGALSLAQQGQNYHQILKNYYPSTGVGRIEEDYN